MLYREVKLKVKVTCTYVTLKQCKIPNLDYDLDFWKSILGTGDSPFFFVLRRPVTKISSEHRTQKHNFTPQTILTLSKLHFIPLGGKKKNM